MKIASLLNPDRIICDVEANSKKRSLEILSETLANDDPGIMSNKVFESLLNREKLGSTGLGHGVALPHGRSDQFTEARLAVIKLDQGIDYDAPDSEPVDLLFALVVPDNATEEHLKILALLAAMFKEDETRAQLREAKSPEDIMQLIREWQSQN